MGTSRAADAEHLTTLAELVRDFLDRLGPEGPLEHGYMEWMRTAPSYPAAVDRAVRSTMPNGKRHNHQSRVATSTLLLFGDRLLHRKRTVLASEDFHALLQVVEGNKVRGIGPVTVYDVAVRLGEYLEVRPDRTYLHAGVKLGAEALGVETKGREWLTRQDLPREMRRLTADEVEDFLCVYRALFPNIKKEDVSVPRKQSVRHQGERK